MNTENIQKETPEGFKMSNQFEAFFKYANEGIIISDQNSRIIKINPSGLKTFGYDDESILIGKEIEILIPITL